MKPIPYARQSISDADIAAVVAILRSDFLTQGPAVERFERRVAEHCGARHAIAVCNATAALHLACLALDVGPGDRVWTSPNTFVASANCARYCGATPDFVDIDPRTYNLSVGELARRLEIAAAAGTLPKVIIPVDFAGQPAELAAIAELARRHGIRIIEDASHAIGAVYQGGPVGDGRYADVTVFSFHPVKIVTTGEGGMLLTNHDDLARRLRRLRTHGITRDPSEMTGPGQGPWYYEQVELGWNYRLTDLQAALGESQVQRLPEFMRRRAELAARYDRLLAGLPLTRPWQHPDGSSAWHLYVIQLDLTRVTRSHRDIFTALRSAGIGVNLHYIPVHLQPDYRRLGFAPGDFPAAETYYERAISLPMFYELTDDEQDRVVDALHQVLG